MELLLSAGWNTFHEKATPCRAAESASYFASVNCASDGAPSASAVARPDGTVPTWRPHGREGLPLADLDAAAATGVSARRRRSAWRPRAARRRAATDGPGVPPVGGAIIRVFGSGGSAARPGRSVPVTPRE